MSELAINRPDRPIKAIASALEAVDATANKDPEHIKVNIPIIFFRL